MKDGMRFNPPCKGCRYLRDGLTFGRFRCFHPVSHQLHPAIKGTRGWPNSYTLASVTACRGRAEGEPRFSIRDCLEILRNPEGRVFEQVAEAGKTIVALVYSVHRSAIEDLARAFDFDTRSHSLLSAVQLAISKHRPKA